MVVIFATPLKNVLLNLSKPVRAFCLQFEALLQFSLDFSPQMCIGIYLLSRIKPSCPWYSIRQQDVR